MVPELEKPRVTEIQVRIDCNGCVQKINKALHGINGIYDVTMDIPQQKLRIIGWADPERIVKAIRKTRKTATICSHGEQPDPAAADQKPESRGPPQEAAEQPPLQAPPTKPTPPAEPPKDQPSSAPLTEKPMPPPEMPRPEASRETVNNGQPLDIKPPPKDVGEVRTMYRQQQNYGYGYRYHNYECDGDRDEHWYRYPGNHRFRNEPPPLHQPQQTSVHVTHSYNTYKPSPYVTDYDYVRSPPRFSHYRRRDWDQDSYYGEEYRISSSSGANGNITSIFSDENPNACRIM